ncbi:MAG: hypothetical protein NZL83_01980 [Candidatus Absconditabacterales bacterium]|nr:hypothetical protein [Candidatus Absconditabacterales bacterium]
MFEKSVQRILAKTGLDTYVSKAMTMIEKYIPQHPASIRTPSSSGEKNEISASSTLSDAHMVTHQPSSVAPYVQEQSSIVMDNPQPINTRMDETHTSVPHVEYQYSDRSDVSTSPITSSSAHMTRPVADTQPSPVSSIPEPIVEPPTPPIPPQSS